MTTAAADALRQALADAPAGLHVGRDGHGDLSLFTATKTQPVVTEDIMRLVGLLLAAAPHLAVWLGGDEFLANGSRIARAITEAAQAMETES